MGPSKLNPYLSGGFQVGDVVTILTEVWGVPEHSKGVIKNVNGAYILVLPECRKEGEEVELYPCEIMPIKECFGTTKYGEENENLP